MFYFKYGGCGFSFWILKIFCLINLGFEWLCGWRLYKVLDWDFIFLFVGVVVVWL